MSASRPKRIQTIAHLSQLRDHFSGEPRFEPEVSERQAEFEPQHGNRKADSQPDEPAKGC